MRPTFTAEALADVSEDEALSCAKSTLAWLLACPNPYVVQLVEKALRRDCQIETGRWLLMARRHGDLVEALRTTARVRGRERGWCGDVAHRLGARGLASKGRRRGCWRSPPDSWGPQCHVHSVVRGAAMESEWYIANGAETIGPVSEDKIRRGIEAGKLGPEVQVARAGTDYWRPLSETFTFSSCFSSQPPNQTTAEKAPSPPMGPPHAQVARGPGRVRRGCAALVSSFAAPPGGLVTAWALVVLVAVGACAWRLFRGSTVDPRDIEAELRPVILDHESVRRAARCVELLHQAEAFQEGKPYVVEPLLGDHCKVVSKGRPDVHRHGGYVPSAIRECKNATGEAPKHENNLGAKIRIACGPDGKPTLVPDSSVRLATELSVHSHLAKVVKDVNAGAVSPRVGQCYFNVKARLIASGEDVQRERCTVLTEVMGVKNVTYDAIFVAAQLADALDRYKKENSTQYEEATKQDKAPAFFDAFLAHEKDAACSSASTVTIEDQENAAQLASTTCL